MKIIRVVFGAYIKFFVYFWTTNNYSNTILFRTLTHTMGDNLAIFRNICIGYNLCKKILSRKKPFFGILCEILQIIAGKLRRFKKITLLLLQACAFAPSVWIKILFMPLRRLRIYQKYVTIPKKSNIWLLNYFILFSSIEQTNTICCLFKY